MMRLSETGGSGIDRKGFDEGFVGNLESFIWLTLVGDSKGFENADSVESNSSICGVSFPEVAEMTVLIFNLTGINIF